MAEQALKQKRAALLFLAISGLLIVQVLWWTFVFVNDVDQMRDLKTRAFQAERSLGGTPAGSPAQFEKEAFHRRLMFISESIFFLGAACVGFWLLFRALRNEERSREIQRNFIEVISHESKTPLTALKLRLEALRDSQPSGSESYSELRLALAEVQRLSGILDKALQLNRMDRYTFTFEDLNLGQVAEDALKRVEPFLREKKIQVTSHLSSDVWVKGDLFGLQSSIQSLIENSALYNRSAEKSLELGVERELGRAVLTVSDNGPGVPLTERERVFERFYRGKAGRRVPGTGLGLYIAKSVIAAHQGVIRLVDRERPGAHFRIELPALRGEPLA